MGSCSTCGIDRENSIYTISFSLAAIFNTRGTQCSAKKFHEVFAINEDGQRLDPKYVDHKVVGDLITVTFNYKSVGKEYIT